MGYLGDFYVRAKSFEILSEVGTLLFVLLRAGVYQAVPLRWFPWMVELIGGDNLRDFGGFYFEWVV